MSPWCIDDIFHDLWRCCRCCACAILLEWTRHLMSVSYVHSTAETCDVLCNVVLSPRGTACIALAASPRGKALAVLLALHQPHIIRARPADCVSSTQNFLQPVLLARKSFALLLQPACLFAIVADL